MYIQQLLGQELSYFVVLCSYSIFHIINSGTMCSLLVQLQQIFFLGIQTNKNLLYRICMLFT